VRSSSRLLKRHLSLPVYDVAMVRRSRSALVIFGVAEHAGPFTEGEIDGDDDGHALIEPAEEMEQRLATGLSERQKAEFVEDDEVHPGQMLDTILPSVTGLNLSRRLTRSTTL
jgi:hypothetical protein